MPVTTPGPQDPDQSAAARRPLLQELSRGIRENGPQAFLQYLRMQTQAQGAASVRARYRLVDFMDEAEACPVSSDGELATDLGTASSEDDVMEEPHLLSDSFPVNPPGPSSCSYLGLGQSFTGSQRLSTIPARAEENWQVVVRIQGLDLSRGYVCGVMEAQNVPQAKSPIITFWEGEIIDNSNHSFFTQKWGANRDTDMKHWAKFTSFPDMEQEVGRHAGKSSQLSSAPCIFMRWKEMYFVNTSEACGLTIAGFYYICLERQSGSVMGYYFDPNSAPFQFLSLKPTAAARGGMSFGSYQLQ